MIAARKLVVSAVACIAVAACSKNNGAASDSSSGAVSNAPADTTAAAAATPTTAKAADSTAGGTAGGDGALLARARIGDSAEVAIASYMRSNSQDAGVKSYASTLVSDHSKGLGEVAKTAKEAGVTLQLPPSDSTAQGTSHTLDHLKSLSGKDRDSAFVNHEVEDHQHDIEDAKQMADSATSPKAKALFKKELPELQKHLAMAKKLQAKLGGGAKK